MASVPNKHMFNNLTNKGNNMNKTIIAVSIFFAASAAMAADKSQISASYDGRVSATAEGIPISATATAQDDISATATAEGDISAPYVAAMSIPVSSPISAPQAQDEGEGSVALAGLGFGLVGLIGVAKVARRKKQKAKSEGTGLA